MPELFHIDAMKLGWFIGDFEPAALNSKLFEVAVKKYNKGDFEKKHHHKIATEVTLVIEGTVLMCEKELPAGSIIKLVPGEATSFLALSDAITVVVKSPSASEDKYLDE